MPQIDVIDSTWIPARPGVVAAIVGDPANWRRWWPALDLAVDEDRGPKGVRWRVRSVADARDAGLAGTAEIWLEPHAEGVVAHLFLRLDAAPGQQVGSRQADRIVDSLRRGTKVAFWRLADELDPGRTARLTGALPGSSG